MVIGTRGLVQIALTALTLVTSIGAFVFAFFFQENMDELYKNISGPVVSSYLPCIRSTLDICANHQHDKCDPRCCPKEYSCMIDPIVGLYCQHQKTQCGTSSWCLDYADILETCPTQTCLEHQRLGRASTYAYILSALGIFLDLSDVISFLRCPDSIVCKSALNVLSCLVKFLAFGTLLGADAAVFLADLDNAKCYNGDGAGLVSEASGMFISYAGLQMISGILSLSTAPISAYWGGKLTGVPYVK